MVAVQYISGPGSFPPLPGDHLSVFNYNVLLPNSVDGWWTYKMYLPPLTEDNKVIASWPYRNDLIRQRIATVDADVVCLQEVSPLSFDSDFAFMDELGYDGKEMFKKGRFRPATFWKSSRCELVSPPVHKDRTLLTAFRVRACYGGDGGSNISQNGNWFVLNCHLQAGNQAPRRVRQINEGVKSALTLARKLKEKDPERNIRLIVCGDFNGGEECGAVRFLEDGFIDESFREDGEAVSSGHKPLPLEKPMTDVVTSVDRVPPPTLVVPELISTLVKGAEFGNPSLSDDVVERLKSIYDRLSTHSSGASERVMKLNDVQRYLTAINGQVGRGSEFREAARQMGWTGDDSSPEGEESQTERTVITIPPEGVLSLDGFLRIYEAELKQGKFWGIAHDLAVLGEPLPDVGVFQSRYDRIYCSSALQPASVIDFVCTEGCPNDREPSDHLPLAASFCLKQKM